jgi:hypothetical protein
MAKFDHGGGCPCGLQKVCDCGKFNIHNEPIFTDPRTDFRDSITYVEDQEPGPAHEVSETVKATILEKHSGEPNLVLEQHKRALDFLEEVLPKMHDLARYIAGGHISQTLTLKRLKSAWQECFSEAIANNLETKDDA